MADLPDIIPADQFIPDEPSLSSNQPNLGSQPVSMETKAPPANEAPDIIPSDQFISDEDKYGGFQQGAIAALEGASQGMAGPLGPLAEVKMGLATKEDIRGRAAAHPIVKPLGEAAGFVAGALTGTGEAALLSKVGEAAEIAAGLGKLSYGARVGSEAIKQAAEMAVFSGGDHVAKMVIKDPEATAQNAIANIGLGAAIGGTFGGLTSGVVSPLWKATAGPKVEQLLNMTKNYIDGGAKLQMGAAEEAAAKTLGIELDPVMRAGMSQDATANGFFGDLRRGEHKAVLEGIERTHNKISNSVMDSLGITPEMVAQHSENQAGHELQEAFQKEIKTKYDPRAAEMQLRDAEAAPLMIPDEARLNHAGSLIEKGIKDVGTDSPYFKEYQHYAERLLAKDTIGQIDKLRTEILGKMKAANRAGDDNTWKALNDIRSSMGDFQTTQIEQAALRADKEALALAKSKGIRPATVEGVPVAPEAQSGAEALIARRRAANENYAKYAGTIDTVMDHLGLGEFKGTKGLISKITEKLSPEELLRKMTIKGNSDIIPFMQEHFPDTLAKILENERKQIVKPAILAAAKKGEVPIDVKKLSEIINKTMSGKPEYVKAVLPELAVQRVEAGRILANAIPSPRDSGTPAGMQKLFRMMPANAVAAISWAMGHGVLGGLMAGEMAQRLGKDAPEAIKLGYLRFLSAEQPVKAEGFKAMVDMLHNTYKGDNMLSKAAANVFKPGAAAIVQFPTSAELVKLDKLVVKNQENPTKYLQAQEDTHVGHYLPNHQVAMTQTTAQAMQYLNSLKPVPTKLGPLDREIEPTEMQEARYNRALTIAQNPAIIYQHIKDGTLQPTDVQDLDHLYPALRSQMAQKLTNEMLEHKADEEPIAYRTRVGVSLFLGQPMDSTMTPASILAAQPKPKQAPPMVPNQTKKGTSTLGKSNNTYKTQSQSGESDRQGRE